MLTHYEYPGDGKALLARWRKASAADPELDRAVWEIIEAVRRRGDRAVIELTRRFDGVILRAREFRIAPEQLKESWESLPKNLQAAIDLAARRIHRFHARQRRKGFSIKDADGAVLEQRVAPLESVGLYVPGGKAAYPSTVLMCAVPAFVAGVERVVMVTPLKADGSLAQRATWGAAWRAGVREAYRIGGAQAVAALAFGTKTIPRVDKVVGPGNRYVATAKKLLYGRIDIDSVAGPSEVMILADETARPEFIAADLMAQAEHDEAASAILVLIGVGKRIRALGQAVEKRLAAMIAGSPRKKIAQASLMRNGALIYAPQAGVAAELANRRAPEHLEIMTRQPRNLSKLIRNAGAIFLGHWCPEAFGDYIAGPNHTLPTSGTARFFSPLSVEDFIKTSNVLESSRRTMRQLGPAAALLADVEGLSAHAESLRRRIQE